MLNSVYTIQRLVLHAFLLAMSVSFDPVQPARLSTWHVPQQKTSNNLILSAVQCHGRGCCLLVIPSYLMQHTLLFFKIHKASLLRRSSLSWQVSVSAEIRQYSMPPIAIPLYCALGLHSRRQRGQCSKLLSVSCVLFFQRTCDAIRLGSSLIL